MKRWILGFMLGCAALLTVGAQARDLDTPVGTWNTFDDKTNRQSGVVSLYLEDGKLYGKVLRVFPGFNKICQDCPGDMKGKPVVGLRFLWGFVPKGDGLWSDGQIIDAQTGDIYRGSINVTDHGSKLLLRGYWMIFWRTQTWVRAG